MSIGDIDSITLPAYWASYLINGDASGLEPGEREQIDLYLASRLEPGWNIIDVSRDDSPRFTWSFSLHGGNAQGGDVLDYVMRRDWIG